MNNRHRLEAEFLECRNIPEQGPYHGPYAYRVSYDAPTRATWEGVFLKTIPVGAAGDLTKQVWYGWSWRRFKG